MHEIREGEEEENVSTTGGEGGKGGREVGKGVGGRGELEGVGRGRGSNLQRRIKLGREDSKYRFSKSVKGRETERERGIKEKDRINSDRISLRGGRQRDGVTG